jgi:hypothetical protein
VPELPSCSLHVRYQLTASSGNACVRGVSTAAATALRAALKRVLRVPNKDLMLVTQSTTEAVSLARSLQGMGHKRAIHVAHQGSTVQSSLEAYYSEAFTVSTSMCVAVLCRHLLLRGPLLMPPVAA